MRAVSIIFIFLLTSCVTEKKRAKICATCPLVTEVKTIIKESIHVKETIKHDTIYESIAGPTVVIPGPCDKLCDGNGKLKKFYQESTKNGIKSKIYTDTIKNTLINECNTDSLLRVNTEKTIEIERIKSELKNVKETVTARCEKQHKDWLDKYDRPWFFISLGALLLFLGWKFKPTLLGLFKKLPL